MRLSGLRKTAFVLLLLAGVACVGGYIVLGHRLPVVMRVQFSDLEEVPSVVVSDAGDRVHVHHGNEVRSYDSKGRQVRRYRLPAGVADEWFVMDTHVPISACRFPAVPPSRSTVLWAHVPDHGEIGLTRLRADAALPWEGVWSVLPAQHGMYMGGEVKSADGPTYPAAVRIGRDGRRRWAFREPLESGFYQHIAVAANGDTVMAGTVGAGAGTCIGRYSANGRRSWFHGNLAYDGGCTLSLGLRPNGDAVSLVKLHDSGDEPGEEDVSGRNQDFVLRTYSPNGKLKKSQVLSHGANMVLYYGAVNSQGELYTLGKLFRRFTVVTKYDAQGRRLWTGHVKIPNRCTAWIMTLDNNDGIYISGEGQQTTSSHPRVKAFVYKIQDRG